MKKLFLLISILTLTSCFFYKKDGVEVNIKNKSNEPITNVEFTTSEKIELINFDKIEPNENVTEFLSMKKNKSDGAYLLTFTRGNGKKEIISNGYYTNGSSLDYWVDFIVENDTTLVKFDAPIY